MLVGWPPLCVISFFKTVTAVGASSYGTQLKFVRTRATLFVCLVYPGDDIAYATVFVCVFWFGSFDFILAGTKASIVFWNI